MAITDRRPVKISVPGTLKNVRIGLQSLDGLKDWQDKGDVTAAYNGDYVNETANPYTVTISTPTNMSTANRRTNSTLTYIDGKPFPPGTALVYDLIAASNSSIAEGEMVANYTTVGGEQLKYRKAVITEAALLAE